MNPSTKNFYILFSMCMLVVSSLACGGSAPNTLPSPVPSAEATPKTLEASPTAVENAVPESNSIEGMYITSGVAPNGVSYGGKLSVAATATSSVTTENAVYDLTWDNGASGTGILIEGILAATYGGPSCGAVFYAIDQHNKLDGVWLTLDTKELGSEIATPVNTSVETLEGEYTVLGTNTNGTEYEGVLSIIDRDDVWQMVWAVGSERYDGIGIEQGNVIAATYGGEGCGVTAYAVQPNGDFDGIWGVWGTNSLGTEYAKRI